jgi:hypothetical protein
MRLQMTGQVSAEVAVSEYGSTVLEQYLITAGGRITCLRCTAKSNRTGKQCEKPALKASRTQKCGHHGGRPHSVKVLQCISEANTVHGEGSKAAKQRYIDDSVLIHELEDALYVLKMATGPRIRGRKPNGYRGVYSEADVIRMIRDRVSHRV